MNAQKAKPKLGTGAYAALLVFAGASWGLGFVETKRLFPFYSPMQITFLRFTLAGFLSLPILLINKSWELPKKKLMHAGVLSFLVFIGMILQAYGLLYTTAGKSGFITSLYIVFVPIIEWFISRKKIVPRFWGALGLAMLGMGAMVQFNITDLNFGDLLTLAAAFVFAFQIIYLGYLAQIFTNSLEINGLQCFGMSIFAGLWLLLSNQLPSLEAFSTSPQSFLNFFQTPIWSLLFLAVFPSFFALAIQVSCQRKVRPHVAAIAFMLESPFALLSGYLILAERPTSWEWTGCVLIFLAVLLTPIEENEA